MTEARAVWKTARAVKRRTPCKEGTALTVSNWLEQHRQDNPRWYEPAAVYRLWDAEGNLLYIGSAFDPEERCKSHRQKPWWSEVARRTEQWFSARGTAYAEEMKAIRAERPKHNQMGTPGYRAPKTAAVLRRDERARCRARELSKSTKVKLATERAVQSGGGSRVEAIIAGLLAEIELLELSDLHERKIALLRSSVAEWQRRLK
jgi:predicted GIY-YIG superfamily endonuclease